MNYLKINDGKGFFYNKDGEYKEIDTIKKEDLFFLLEEATNPEKEFVIEEMSEDSIKNEAHKIIYLELSKKFKELLENKNRFLDESESLYREAFHKYDN